MFGFNIVNHIIANLNGKSYPAYEMILVLSRSSAQQNDKEE